MYLPFKKNYNMKKIILVLAAGSFLMVACNDASKTDTTVATKDSTTVFDLSSAKKDLEADNARFMEEIKKGDSNALAEHYHSEGVLLLDNAAPTMRKDISSAWAAFGRMGGKELRLNTTDLVGDENLLVETGTYDMVGDNNKTLDKGKYVVVYKKENGQWKIYRDIANSNTAMAPVK